MADPRLQAAAERIGARRVKQVVAAAQALARQGSIAPLAVADEAVARMPALAGSLTRVVNATGVVLHTNLGRAPLSTAAVHALIAASGTTDVEFDLSTGQRAPRGRGVLDSLRAAVPDADDIAVVNNGAAALVLATTALAAGREIIISRGELIEIGDGFRLPDLIRSTGARLREVGTTNRTNIDDYSSAIGPDTACILKIHASNFRMSGFTRAVSVAQLSSLGVPVVVDIGSGLLRPDRLLPNEPDVTTTLRAGASLVTASGDKLLGGPQAGLIFGNADMVKVLRRHPLARALRVDKLTLAALEATVDGPPTPTWQALHADPVILRARTDAIIASVSAFVDAYIVASDGAVGGGSAPDQVLPGCAVSLPSDFARELRLGNPPIVGRRERGRCLLDLRCVPAESDELIVQTIRRISQALPGVDDR